MSQPKPAVFVVYRRVQDWVDIIGVYGDVTAAEAAAKTHAAEGGWAIASYVTVCALFDGELWREPA